MSGLYAIDKTHLKNMIKEYPTPEEIANTKKKAELEIMARMKRH